jgi:hypothetical protein
VRALISVIAGVSGSELPNNSNPEMKAAYCR